ncbi:hypothetical protein PO909_000387 [Leuciscus waleckii]
MFQTLYEFKKSGKVPHDISKNILRRAQNFPSLPPVLPTSLHLYLDLHLILPSVLPPNRSYSIPPKYLVLQVCVVRVFLHNLYLLHVINAYLTCLVRNYSGRAFVLDSFQATNIWKRKASLMKRMIYPKERRILYVNSFGESRGKLLHCRKVVR